MSNCKYLLLLFITIVHQLTLNAQHVQIIKEQVIALTPEWKGESFPLRQMDKPKIRFVHFFSHDYCL